MFKRLLRCLYHGTSWLHITHPVVIVKMDGGICSQMQQYLMGQYLRSKGLPVEYDLSFFAYAKDCEGRHARNFDLLKAFPKLDFKAASRWKRRIYRSLFIHNGQYPKLSDTSWIDQVAPIFLGGYFQEVPEMYHDYSTLFKVDSDVLDSANLTIYSNIPSDSVAVHIRRGDLSHYTEAYGEPATVTYFIQAVQWFQQRLAAPMFYLFSDDMEYVQQEILPHLPVGTQYQMVENTPEHGYYDLILMSRCSHHITSKGSLAKFASCLHPAQGFVIALEDDRQLGPLAFASDKEVIRLQ